jgi:hypothetical protein
LGAADVSETHDAEDILAMKMVAACTSKSLATLYTKCEHPNVD